MKISPVNFTNFNQRKVNFQSSFITAHGNNEQKNEQGIPQSICDIRDTVNFDMTVTSECEGAHCRIQVDDTHDSALIALLETQGIYWEPANESSTAHVSPQTGLKLPSFMTKA